MPARPIRSRPIASLLATLLLAGVGVGAALVGCQTGSTGPSLGSADLTTGARLYEGYDGSRRAISTTSPEAQRWFDQGLQQLYGFNHDEAIRSFHEAARLDPDCPMPWWGIAHAYGVNINKPGMPDAHVLGAWEAVTKMRACTGPRTPGEQALIDAIGERYAFPAPEDRRPLDRAFADAMETAWRAHPDDPDIGALYADALMNLQPWDYWENDGAPKGRTPEIVRTLERVMASHPDHPGACHLYIHAVEASGDPDRALAAADRLADRVPGSGHLVHMPSHIYVRVGRYADAADANVRAVEADRTYIRLGPGPRNYWLYYMHNLHFLAFASMMEGRYETAIGAARDLEREIPDEFIEQWGWLAEGLMATNYHVLVRFGKWDEILNEPMPPEHRLVSRAVHHYARGIALSALGRPAEARVEAERFEAAFARVPEGWYIFNNKAHDVLPIARAMLAGEITFREGDHDEAFRLLREGVAGEDRLVYDEPPGWMLPVRHALGALLMSDGRYAEAEAVYREDLERNRENGWALLGLDQALMAQRKHEEMASVMPRLQRAWARADVRPMSSCFCEPSNEASRPIGGIHTEK